MVTLLGAAPNTGNQGVSALCFSAVAGMAARGITGIDVADHGRGRRQMRWDIAGGEEEIGLIGLSHTRRIWRGDCLRTVAAMARFGGLGNAAAKTILSARAVLDVSGGDSFTDLYGAKRFDAMCRNKRLALDNGRPLILLPQTLGPFRDPANEAAAIDILSRATAVWVRDRKSHDFLKAALGEKFDPRRHRLGVDMAVLLPAVEPSVDLPAAISSWLADEMTPVAGLNVSGLLFNDAQAAKADFGLADSHARQIEAAARALLDSDPALRLVLVPHVLRPAGDPESDHDACSALEARLAPDYAGRVAVLPQDYTATELKWIIARLDWFAGARMHATIAGFSSGVPTLGLGYSDKAFGVFEQCGIGEAVADLRQTDAGALARAVRASYLRRDETRIGLVLRLEEVFARANEQMDEIVATIRALEA